MSNLFQVQTDEWNNYCRIGEPMIPATKKLRDETNIKNNKTSFSVQPKTYFFKKKSHLQPQKTSTKT